MPIYEFQCRKCGHCFETLVLGRSEEQPPACPKCGEKEVDRRMSAACVIGAGSGGCAAPGNKGFS